MANRLDETLDLEGQAALLSVLRGLGARNLALRVGRYELGEVLGHGACGQVYAARDPKLDREVAIKVVISSREGPDPDAEARLQREATALARLQHPHVVPVYDVGVDDIGAGTGVPARRGVFVVMARIRGRTLLDWLREAKPAAADIVRAFVQAAEGLAAAHAVGVVHRDFKPTNAMMTDDGTVIVLDFGLARALDEPAARDTDRSDRAWPLDASPSFTATGTVVGTPRYMAPEQHIGQPVTAAVDQYAWCVALWEALSGAPPFAANTFAELTHLKQKGELPIAPMIAAPLRSVLARGMRTDPRARWPSMHALCEALTRSATQRRRRIALAAIGVLTIGSAGAWGFAELDRERRLAQCRAEGEAIASVWNETRAAEIATAFDATAVVYAQDTWRRSRAWLDAYAAEWSETRRAVCEATEVDRTLAAELALASRMCLDDHRDRMDALLHQLRTPDPLAVNKATTASASLPRVVACSEDAEMRRWADLPSDPQTRLRIAELRARLIEASAARATGRYDDALARAEAVLREATALKWLPLTAQAKLVASDAYDSLGRPEDSRRMAEQAYFEAEAVGRDDLALLASSALVYFVGNQLGRHDEAVRWGRFAQILAQRSGSDPVAVARLFTNLGSVHRVHGDNAQALELNERALALYDETLGARHPLVATSLNNLGTVYIERGQYAEARAALERGLEIDIETLGAEHPLVASSLNNLGVVHQRLDDSASARGYHERALAIRERIFGPEHPDVAVSLNNLATAQRYLGEHAMALHHYERALAIFQKAYGPEHREVGATLDNLGILHRSQRDYAQAIDLHERALALRQQVLGPEHPDVGTSLNNLGQAYQERGDRDRALEHYERALAIWRSALGQNHPRVAVGYENIGDAHHAAGAHAQAIEAFEQALAIRESGAATPAQLASTRFRLAGALWDGGSDHARAIDLAGSAAELLRPLGRDGADALAQTEAWLASRSASTTQPDRPPRETTRPTRVGVRRTAERKTDEARSEKGAI